jgi:protein tyrosine phosphatase (PTP) superfamily phosphohydrolase (DUF442 family)
MQKINSLVGSQFHAQTLYRSLHRWLRVVLMACIMFTTTVQADTATNETGTSVDSLGTPAAPVPAPEDIINYRQYSPVYASSGQPAREQFESIKAAGFERVIYIAFSHYDRAISDEDKLVKGLGMRYLHIPVDFDNPQVDEFAAFATYLQAAPNKKTLLHCQVNYRASAFSFLYRVIYEGVSVAEAKEDMNSVWQPDAVWRDFIFDVLQEHDISPECEVCDWAPPAPMTSH